MAKTIKHDENGKAFFGGDDHLQISQQKSFPQLIFELLSARVPTDSELKIFELILNLSVDHGPDTPSAVEVIKAAKEGKTISESVAAGVLQINNSHGGAMEPAMELFYKINNEELRIADVVSEKLTNKERIAGFGHRIYEVDPRAQLILEKLKEAGIGQEFVDIALEVEKELKSQTGKNLPINIDGAIAAVLCSFGWEPKLGKAVFLIARTPGLCGQYLDNVK